MPDAPEQLPIEITVAQLKQLRTSSPDGLFLLDCRTPDEHAHGYISGATLIPMQEITERVEELAVAKGQLLVVYCHLGVRSEMVARWLRENGYPDTQSLVGGIEAWDEVEA